jgi:hypothetical protein
MKITRMLDGGGSSAARDLLASALVDQPPASAFARTAVSMGVAGAGTAISGAVHGATAGATSTALASGAPGAAGGTLVVAKWLLIGALAGGVVSSAAVVATPPRVEAPAPAPARAVATHDTAAASPLPTRAPLPPAARETIDLSPTAQRMPEARAVAVSPAAKPPEPVPSQEPRTATSTAAEGTAPTVPASPDRSNPLREEVAMIDAARTALVARDSTTALSILNRYQADVSTHVLDREARLLRIDALSQSGDRVGAARLAQIYLNDFPNDPNAPRLRTLSASMLAPRP